MYRLFGIIVLILFIIVVFVLFSDRESNRTVATGGENLVCSDEGRICFEDVSSLLDLPDLGGARRPYSGQTWSASWGFWDDNDWPDLYLNHHTRRATIGRFPESHLVLNPGRDRNWSFIEFQGKDQHSATFIDIDRDGDEDVIEAIGGRRGTAAPEDTGSFNLLHLNGAEPGDASAAAISAGLAGPAMRGRSIIPFSLGGQIYLFLANAPREEPEYGSAVFGSTGDGLWQRVALFNLAACEVCDPLPMEIDYYKGAVFGDISGDGTTDAILYGDPEAKKQISVFLGQPDGLLVRSQMIFTPQDVLAAQILDLDGDLKADALLRFRSSLGVLYGVGEANQESRLFILPNNGTRIVDFAAGDFNNDSLIDVIMYGGREERGFAAGLLRNLGSRNFDLGFLRMKEEKGIARNVAVADFDLDGVLDLLFTDGKGTPEEALNSDGGYVLLRGVSSGNSLSIDVFDDDGVRSLGARVEVRFGEVQRVFETTSGVIDEVQNSRRIHIGMGDETVATVQVRWANGQMQTIEGVAANQLLKVTQTAGGLGGN
jgi:ASPIC/UnbV protein